MTWRSVPDRAPEPGGQPDPEGLAALPLHAAADWRKLLRLVAELDARVQALEAPKEVTR